MKVQRLSLSSLRPACSGLCLSLALGLLWPSSRAFAQTAPVAPGSVPPARAASPPPPAAAASGPTVGAQALPAASKVVPPGENLVVEGVPPISRELADRVSRYTEFRGAGFSDWHPLRRELLMVTRFADVPQIHRLLMPGGARTQLTFFPDRVSGATFEPTRGDYFLFSKDVGGGEWFQLFRYDLKSGDITLLTDGKSRNTGAIFNRRGDRVAYMSTRRNGRDNDLWVMNPLDKASDKQLLQLTGGGWGAEDFAPDAGERGQLVLGEEVSANESYLWLVDLATAEKKLLTPKGLPEKVAYFRARYATDGKGIYVTTDKESEFRRLTYIDLATGKHTYLTTSIKWDVEDYDLSRDGKTLVFATNENGISRIYVMATATKQFRPLAQVPVGVVGGLAIHPSGSELGFTLSAARSNADVYSVNLRTGKLDRWTHSETGGLPTEEFSEPQLVKWQSFDGREISGFLYLPNKRFTGKRPVVVNIHGGPEAQFRPTFLGRNNYYLNELGVALLFPNVRGSTGYGKTFLQLDDGFRREDSYKDAEALYKWIKQQPNLDGERIMVTGGSYGGHMTLVSATHHNALIRCSLAVVGMSNLVTFLERTEGYRRDLRRVEYGDERDGKMRSFLTGIAPLSRASSITKPLFIVQGQNDPRVPASEAEQMIKTVRASRTPAWYLLAKDEGHGFAKKRNQDFQFYATILFMQEYLLK
ncbi:MAG TPA: prolyl oligopeptidase family serine peptidase [Pseudomonadota bacterium]|nr:prolyl oligopeptidase family serine peptidase [Pseudomonadota bacterium]